MKIIVSQEISESLTSDLGKGWKRIKTFFLLLCCNKVAVCVASFSSAHRHTVCTSQDQRHTSSTANEWKWKQKTVFSYFHSSEFQFPSSHNIYICCLSSLRKRLRPGGKQIKISRSKAAESWDWQNQLFLCFAMLYAGVPASGKLKVYMTASERESEKWNVNRRKFILIFDIYQFSSPLTALQIA